MRTLRALALATLLLLPLVPMAEAAGPTARHWSAYGTGSETVAIAMAREGTTIAAALGSAISSTTTTAPVGGVGLPTPTNSQAQTDLAILDHEYGFARNASVNQVPPPPATQALVPQGRSHVAVSREGNAVAALGIELGPAGSGGGAGSNQYLRLYHAIIPAGGNWSGTTPTESRIDLGSTSAVQPIGLALSDDGRRVAVLTREGANYAIRGYTYGTSLVSAFQSTGVGVPRALAASGDLSRVLVAGQFAAGNFTYGGGQLYEFSSPTPLATYYDTSANNTDARGAALSRNASVMAIGGDGKLSVFHGALTSPTNLTFGAGGLGNLTISDDGTRLASSGGNTLTTVDLTRSAVRIVYNATLTGQNVTRPAMDATGSLILVGTTGTGGALFGFSDADAQPLWTVPGETRSVAVDSAGVRIAYAQRTSVAATRVERAFTMDLGGGAKLAPQQTVTAPGRFTLNVTLRNDGAGMERIEFSDTSDEITVTSTPAVVSLRPGTIVPVNLTIDVAAGLSGPRVFNVTARSLTSGLVDNVTASVAPRPTLDVKLAVNETTVLAEPGRPATVLFAVVNNGTGNANVALRATQTVSTGAPWTLQLSDSTLTTLRGTRQPVTLTLTPPADVVNGTSSTVVVTLEGQDIFDTARITFRVNPELRIEVEATPSTRYLAPGQRGSFNVTVANTGSLPRDVEIYYAVLEDNAPGNDRQWGITMDAQTTRIEAGSRRVIELEVTAPADVLPDERVGIRVLARSLAEPGVVNDTLANDSVDVYAVAIAPKVTTPTSATDDVPAPAALVVVAAVSLLALLHRRRRS